MTLIDEKNANTDMKCDRCGSIQKGILCGKCYHDMYQTNEYGYPEKR